MALFLPLSVTTILIIRGVPSTTVWHHAGAVLIAVLLHALIVVGVVRRFTSIGSRNVE